MSQGWRHYPFAHLLSFHDGDTCEVRIDHGFTIEQRISVRLFGIHCPETRGSERSMGFAALKQANEVIWGMAEDGVIPCRLWTWKVSFSRYVGRVVVDVDDVARLFIGLGLGFAWDGKTERRPFKEFPIAKRVDELAEYDRLLARDFKP